VTAAAYRRIDNRLPWCRLKSAQYLLNEHRPMMGLRAGCFATHPTVTWGR